jgi:hypothetical protein
MTHLDICVTARIRLELGVYAVIATLTLAYVALDIPQNALA